MNCQEAKWRMSLALDRMLPAPDERVLQAHLSDCPMCGAEWEALQSVSQLLATAPLASRPMELAVRVEGRLYRQRERRRWALGLIAGWLWLGVDLSSFLGWSVLLGWLLLRQPAQVSAGIQVLARLLLLCQATLRALSLLGTSLPGSWLSVGINGCVVPALMLACLWAWLALGRRQQRMLSR